MITKPYYGVDRVPPGHHAASMIEAAQAKQVKRWGLHKIDPLLLAAKFKVIGPKAEDYRSKVIGLRGKVADIIKKHKRATTLDAKKKLEAEHAKAVADLKQASAEYEAFKANPKKQQILVTPDPKKQPGYYKKLAELKVAREADKKAKEEAKRRRAEERQQRKDDKERAKEEAKRKRMMPRPKPAPKKKVVKKPAAKKPVAKKTINKKK